MQLTDWRTSRIPGTLHAGKWKLKSPLHQLLQPITDDSSSRQIDSQMSLLYRGPPPRQDNSRKAAPSSRYQPSSRNQPSSGNSNARGRAQPSRGANEKNRPAGRAAPSNDKKGGVKVRPPLSSHTTALVCDLLMDMYSGQSPRLLIWSDFDIIKEHENCNRITKTKCS